MCLHWLMSRLHPQRTPKSDFRVRCRPQVIETCDNLFINNLIRSPTKPNSVCLRRKSVARIILAELKICAQVSACAVRPELSWVTGRARISSAAASDLGYYRLQSRVKAWVRQSAGTEWLAATYKEANRTDMLAIGDPELWTRVM